MNLIGHILITLRPGERFAHVPSHLDYVLGAARRASRLDGGPLDTLLNGRGSAFRATCAFHSRQAMGRVGEQHSRFDDLEELLGMSRTYKVEVVETERAFRIVQALRELRLVETAQVQTLATVPYEVQTHAQAGSSHQIGEAFVAHERIRAPEALAIEPGDARLSVAVVDTGVNLGHPELQRKLLAGYNTVDLGMGPINEAMRLVGDSRGPDFTPLDHVGHGSHCAGAIGAQGWRLPKGVAGEAMVLPIRVLAAALQGNGKRRVGIGGLGDINAGLKVAVDLGADVINMSLGTPESAVDPESPPPHAEMARYADHYGCVLVAAAGNSGKEERFYPAALPEVLAVGSVDAHGRRSHFSTWGSHLAISAPGEGIVSIGMHGYRRSTGTSHAAPFVSGVAALVVSRARRKGQRLSGAQVRQILTESASPLGDGRYSPETGYGLLDAQAALKRLDAALDGRAPLRDTT